MSVLPPLPRAVDQWGVCITGSQFPPTCEEEGHEEAHWTLQKSYLSKEGMRGLHIGGLITWVNHVDAQTGRTYFTAAIVPPSEKLKGVLLKASVDRRVYDVVMSNYRNSVTAALPRETNPASISLVCEYSQDNLYLPLSRTINKMLFLRAVLTRLPIPSLARQFPIPEVEDSTIRALVCRTGINIPAAQRRRYMDVLFNPERVPPAESDFHKRVRSFLPDDLTYEPDQDLDLAPLLSTCRWQRDHTEAPLSFNLLAELNAVTEESPSLPIPPPKPSSGSDLIALLGAPLESDKPAAASAKSFPIADGAVWVAPSSRATQGATGLVALSPDIESELTAQLPPIPAAAFKLPAFSAPYARLSKQPLLPAALKELEKVRAIADKPGSVSDRLTGIVVAQAVGDAIGLTTEFVSKAVAQQMMKLGPLEYSTRFATEQYRKLDPRANWRHNFPFNGWTDDTDQAFCVLRALMSKKESKAAVGQRVAQELCNWIQGGLVGRDFTAQLGGRETPLFLQPAALGLGRLFIAVTGGSTDPAQRALFIANPKQQALAAWKDPKNAFAGEKPAPNGALMRTAPLVTMFPTDLKELITVTIEVCETTHVDPRCVASCVALNVALFHLVLGETKPDKIKAVAFDEASVVLQQKTKELVADGSIKEGDPAYDPKKLRETIYAAKLDDLHLDGFGQGIAIGGTYQCLGAAFVSLTNASSFIDVGAPTHEVFRGTITALVGEGGDADSNSAVAAAMLGARLGFSAIPHTWRELRDQSILLEMLNGCKIADNSQLLTALTASVTS
jgi:ADP-ribosylglycohydrolase